MELRSDVSGLRLFGLSSLWDTSWNLMTCVRTEVLGGRGARRELRAILVALSMLSAGLGEPEPDVARAWGWPWMSLPALLLSHLFFLGPGPGE